MSVWDYAGFVLAVMVNVWLVMVVQTVTSAYVPPDWPAMRAAVLGEALLRRGWGRGAELTPERVHKLNRAVGDVIDENGELRTSYDFDAFDLRTRALLEFAGEPCDPESRDAVFETAAHHASWMTEILERELEARASIDDVLRDWRWISFKAGVRLRGAGIRRFAIPVGTRALRRMTRAIEIGTVGSALAGLSAWTFIGLKTEHGDFVGFIGGVTAVGLVSSVGAAIAREGRDQWRLARSDRPAGTLKGWLMVVLFVSLVSAYLAFGRWVIRHPDGLQLPSTWHLPHVELSAGARRAASVGAILLTLGWYARRPWGLARSSIFPVDRRIESARNALCLLLLGVLVVGTAIAPNGEPRWGTFVAYGSAAAFFVAGVGGVLAASAVRLRQALEYLRALRGAGVLVGRGRFRGRRHFCIISAAAGIGFVAIAGEELRTHNDYPHPGFQLLWMLLTVHWLCQAIAISQYTDAITKAFEARLRE